MRMYGVTDVIHCDVDGQSFLKSLKGGTVSSLTTFRPVLQSFLLPTGFVSMSKGDRSRG